MYNAGALGSGAGSYSYGDWKVLRYPTLPSLEQYVNVDVQIGGRLFQQVPPKSRSDLWSSLTRKSATGQACIMKYPALQAQNVNAKTCGEIDKDVPRTFPDVPGFNDPTGQRRLVRILRSYSLLDPEVGYCQGMNFVAGLLLKYLSNEADAFGTFCVLMMDRNYRELFLPHMIPLKNRMSQLERLLPQSIYQKLEGCSINAALYAPQWLLSCFANEMPTTFAARIIDALLGEEGGVAAEVLLKVASRVLQKLERTILCAGDFESVLKGIRNLPRQFSSDEMRELLSEALMHQWTPLERSILCSQVQPPVGSSEGRHATRQASQMQRHQPARSPASHAETPASASPAAQQKTSKYSLLGSDVMDRLRK